MQYKTRGGASPQGKPRVYFTGHPEDCKRYFDELSDLILKTQNCAVFYDPDPERPEDEENFLSDLDRMQLIVLIVTHRYVYGDTFAHDTVFRHAMEKHIPVLPILEESGIERDFDKKCGDIQYLDPNARDDTQEPFEEKLKKFLDSVLVGDELARQVREAFDAYVFLSYRKKDRRFAQQLMHLIHESEFCRDIAIWYDEFLVPGENFNAAIQQALEKSDLFALVVTPSLLEDPNYVMTTEYPAAQAAGKAVLPALLANTDTGELTRRYKGLPTPVDPATPALGNALRQALAGVADPRNDDDPKHLYFIGLAYLGGIDVEVNHLRAVELITQAAEAQLPEAIEKLVNMYNTGEGVARDYGAAVDWQRRLVTVRQREYEAAPNADSALRWLNALWRLGDALYDLRRLTEAKETFLAMLTACGELPADGSIPWRERYIAVGCSKLGDLCQDEGDLPAAREWYEKNLAISEALARKTGTITERRVLAVSYERLGDLCRAEGSLPAAREWYEKLLVISEQLARETDTVDARRGLAGSYSRLGDLCRDEGNLPAAREWFEKALAIQEPLARETGTVEARRGLAINYGRLGDLCRDEGDLPAARKWYNKDIAISAQLARETGTVEARRGLAIGYGRLGDIRRAEDKLPAARKCFEKYFAITESLARGTGTPEARRDLAIAHSKLGDLCRAEGNLPAAREWFEKDLAISEPLARETGTVEARRDLTINYSRLGDLCRAEGNLPAAREWFEKALAIREPLVREAGTPEMRRDLAASYHRLGELSQAEDDPPAARAWFEKSLAILEPLARETGAVEARRDLALSYERLGDLCRDRVDLPDAPKWFEKGIAIREALARETGTIQARWDLAILYSKMGDCHSIRFSSPSSVGWYEDSIAITEALVRETGTAEARRFLASSYAKLGDLWLSEHYLFSARDQHKKAFAIREALVRETGTIEARQDLARSYEDLGKLELAGSELYAGRNFAARKQFKEAIAIREALARETGTAEAWDDLAASYFKLADCTPYRRERRRYYQQAKKIWAGLSARHPDVPRYAKNLSTVRDAIRQRSVLHKIRQFLKIK